MTLPRTVADVLAEHVSFEVECIDRMYLVRASTFCAGFLAGVLVAGGQRYIRMCSVRPC